MIDSEKGMKIAVGVFAVAMIVFGTWAIVDPALLGSYDPNGRRAFFKGLVKSVWGTTGGIVAIVFGALSLTGVFVTKVEEVQGKETPNPADVLLVILVGGKASKCLQS